MAVDARACAGRTSRGGGDGGDAARAVARVDRGPREGTVRAI